MLEAEHEVAAGRVVTQGGPRARDAARPREARAAQRVARVELEGQAAARAERPVDPCQRRPAVLAEPGGTGHDRIAAQAGGRDDRVETQTRGAEQQVAHRPDDIHGRRSQHDARAGVNDARARRSLCARRRTRY